MDIFRLLNQREYLICLAIELYGLDFYNDNKFKISFIGFELEELEKSLTNLGWTNKTEHPNPKINTILENYNPN